MCLRGNGMEDNIRYKDEEKLTNEERLALIKEYTEDINYLNTQIENGLKGEALTDARNDIKYDEKKIEELKSKLPTELKGIKR